MAEQQSSIALSMALFAVLSLTHHFQAQGEGTIAGAWGPTPTDGGQTDTAEFVLLETIPDQRLLAATVGTMNTTTDSDKQMTKLTCLQCHCCLNNTNPQVCLTTCCYQRISGYPQQVVSCGCNHCIPPPAPAPPRTN